MNKETTSKEEILSVAKKQAEESGLSYLSMRNIASSCHIALGTIYHYFNSKNELVSSLMEEFWREAFASYMIKTENCNDFRASFKDFYRLGVATSDEFSRKYLSSEKDFPSELMQMSKDKEAFYFGHIKEGLKRISLNDKKVNINNFTSDFTLEDFISLLLNECVISLRSKKDNLTFLEKLIDLVMYRKEGI